MDFVKVVFVGTTGRYSPVYHRPECWHLNQAQSTVKDLPWKTAFNKGIRACLSCHRFSFKSVLCPNCPDKVLLPTAEPGTGKLKLICSCGFTLKQKTED